jgi:hypothetical protein
MGEARQLQDIKMITGLLLTRNYRNERRSES